MKKYIAEFIGTFTLVFIGCGSTALTGGVTGFLGILGIAFAFGLSVVAMSYAIGHISGCHINPAISLAKLITKELSVKDFFGYMISQVLGGIAGSGFLYYLLTSLEGVDIAQIGLGTNGFDKASAIGLGMIPSLLVEIVLTFLFVFTVCQVTTRKDYKSTAGLIAGLALVLVHIIGIPLTGTSVNPARSLAPALFLQGTTLSQVWIFIVGPSIGGALAGIVYLFLNKEDYVNEDITKETIEEIIEE